MTNDHDVDVTQRERLVHHMTSNNRAEWCIFIIGSALGIAAAVYGMILICTTP